MFAYVWIALGFFYSGIASGYWGWPDAIVDKQALAVSILFFVGAVAAHRKGA